jgi:hypothetical protein
LRVEGRETAPLFAPPFSKSTNRIRLQFSGVIVEAIVAVC